MIRFVRFGQVRRQVGSTCKVGPTWFAHHPPRGPGAYKNGRSLNTGIPREPFDPFGWLRVQLRL